ncbi:MAG: hypothetical protein QM753_04385 [Thermomicrobiales bacterium]
MIASTFTVSTTDPTVMFAEDISRDPGLAPQLQDPLRVARLEIVERDYPDEREPDIVTPRTKAYIVRWRAHDEVVGPE